MLCISFSVGASPGACGLELASLACASARTGRGTGCELAGLGRRLEGELSDAVPDEDLAVELAVFVVETPDVFAAGDEAADGVGAADCAWAMRPGAIMMRPASKARAARFRV
jgi:hypothetical protein